MRGGNDGIDGQVRTGAVTGTTVERHVKAHGTGHPGTGHHADLADLQRIIYVQGKTLVHGVLLQRLHHGSDAAVGLLALLKAAVHGALQLVLDLCQHTGGTQHHGHVGVMAAGVAGTVIFGDTDLGTG